MDIANWLTEQIEAHTPERESDPAAAARLAEAYAALAGSTSSTQAFGLALPADIDGRDALRTRALEVLKQWLGKLDGDAKEKIRAQLAGYGFAVGQSSSGSSGSGTGDS
ncbi:MAG TPA: hypothetical protein VFQ53_21250 [Kofleriaceae bacterium]|nr:hypothetical protein [Kofleriaceae bacterium]